MPQSQAETGAPRSWSIGLDAMPPSYRPLLKMGLKCSHFTRTRPRSRWWAVMAPAVCRTPGYEHSCRGVPQPHPVLPPQRLGRQWTGVTTCPRHALARAAAVTLATTASAVIRACVPSVYRSFGCQDGSLGEGEGRVAQWGGQSTLKGPWARSPEACWALCGL